MFRHMVADREKYPSLQAALFHPSCTESTFADRLAFQRLELLGDSVLDLIITDVLLNKFPQASEGEITIRRSRIVDEKSLAQWAKKALIPAKIRKNTHDPNDRIIADSVEAILGAIYTDRGLKEVKQYVEKEILKEAIEEEGTKNVSLLEWNAKGDLQTAVHKMDVSLKIEYELLRASGPAHNKEFFVCVKIGGEVMGEGQGSTKKLAEKDAAQRALVAFSKNNAEMLPLKERKTAALAILQDVESSENHVVDVPIVAQPRVVVALVQRRPPKPFVYPLEEEELEEDERRYISSTDPSPSRPAKRVKSSD